MVSQPLNDPNKSNSIHVHLNLRWTDLSGLSLYCPARYTNYSR